MKAAGYSYKAHRMNLVCNMRIIALAYTRSTRTAAVEGSPSIMFLCECFRSFVRNSRLCE